MEKVAAAQHEAQDGNTSIHDVLHTLIHRITQEPGRTPALTRSLVTAFISNDEVRELVRTTLGRGREILAGIIATGQKRGEIRQDRKPASLALAFQRNVLGTLLLWAMQPGAELPEWLEETFTDFWAAIESRERTKDQVTARQAAKIANSGAQPPSAACSRPPEVAAKPKGFRSS
jgi:hypothetical protein